MKRATRPTLPLPDPDGPEYRMVKRPGGWRIFDRQHRNRGLRTDEDAARAYCDELNGKPSATQALATVTIVQGQNNCVAEVFPFGNRNRWDAVIAVVATKTGPRIRIDNELYELNKALKLAQAILAACEIATREVAP